jgi:hypothetical protein
MNNGNVITSNYFGFAIYFLMLLVMIERLDSLIMLWINDEYWNNDWLKQFIIVIFGIQMGIVITLSAEPPFIGYRNSNNVAFIISLITGLLAPCLSILISKIVNMRRKDNEKDNI